MTLKEVINKSKDISKRIDKNYLSILFDICICKKKYFINSEEYFEYTYYKLNDTERSTFINKKINNDLINKYNSGVSLKDLGSIYESNKEYLNREYIDLREVSFKDFISFIKDKEKILCRNSNPYINETEVKALDKELLKNEYNILKLYNSIMKKNNVIVEEYKGYNKELYKVANEFYIHIITINNNIVLNVIKVKKDNEYMVGFLNDEGVVVSPFIDSKNNTYKQHPYTYENLYELKIPYFNIIKEIVSSSMSGYIEWVFTIGEDAPLLINILDKPSIYEYVIINKEGNLKKYEKFYKD